MEFKYWDDCWAEENKNRTSIDKNRICTFGIKCLDDPLIGILPNDLIVLGADAGVGKSEIVLKMALHNAMNGKNVGLYFIEGGANEAIARIKWKMMTTLYFEKYTDTSIDLDYRKWRMNMVDSKMFDLLEREAMENLKEKVNDKLHLFSFDSSFNVDDLTRSLGWFAKQRLNTDIQFYETVIDLDLIIVDHLQYFDLDSNKNEFQEMTEILKKVKEITNFYNIPVILVSHLRKKEKDRGLPSQEDFYGTSNIAKIASIAVTISPDKSFDDYSKELYPTFFRIAKSRTGIRTSYAMRCMFDFKKGEYQKKYEMYRLQNDMPLKEAMEWEKWPKWARNTDNQRDIDLLKRALKV